jgi:hypothetical protein
MQPFHVKQVWVKRGEVPEKRIPKEEPHEDSSSSSPNQVQVVPLPSWEDMFPRGLEMMRHVEQRKKETCISNPYRYNLQGSLPKTHLDAPPLKTKEHLDEVEEKITKLEQISKACVDTIGEGVDAYWMMSKDLDKKVDDIDGRVELLVKIVLEMAEGKKKLQISQGTTSQYCITLSSFRMYCPYL